MAETLRTLIVDDEPLAIERLQILCARVPRISLVGTAMDGPSVLRQLELLRPDLILLDIQMPGMNGMELAQVLSARDPRPAIIFVTAFTEFAVAAFEVNAVDYLLKPVESERLARAVARIGGSHEPVAQKAEATSWTREFWVPDRSGMVRIAARDIELVEAERDYMRLHVGPRSFLLHETITALEHQLNPEEFVRLHRSTLARRDCISAFRHNGAGAWEAGLKDGRWLRVGRSYLANARAMLERTGAGGAC